MSQADEDASGFLELKELRAALKLVGFDLPGHEVRVLEDELKKSDANRDGKLSLDEFQNVSELGPGYDLNSNCLDLFCLDLLF